MTALARVVIAPLRHERRHQIGALGKDLREGLEDRRSIGCVEAPRIADGGFDDAGTGFSVERLDRTIEGFHQVE